MTEVAENWIPIWRGLAVTLLREGYCSMKAVEKWAKDNKWRLRTVSDVIQALASRALTMKARFIFA